MEYTIQRCEPVSDEIKRIVEGKIEAGIEHIDGDMNRHETVPRFATAARRCVLLHGLSGRCYRPTVR